MIKLYNFDELKPEEILNRDIRAEKNVEDVVDAIIADVKSSEPVNEQTNVMYPGEPELRNISENKEQGIPVIEEVWQSVLDM